MSYLRSPGEPAADFRERIRAVWETYIAPWPEEFRTRGRRRTQANVEEVTEFALLLDEYADMGLIPQRNLRLMFPLKVGDYHEKKGRRSKKKRRAGVILVKYGKTDFGKYVFQKLMQGGATPERIAEWLAKAYMDILPTLPERVDDRTYLQIQYDDIDMSTGEPFHAEKRSRPLPANSTYESLLPLFSSVYREQVFLVKSDYESTIYRLQPDPDSVEVHYLPKPPAGGGRAKAGLPKTLEDGTIVRDYECSAGTCLVAVCNRLGGAEVPRPLKWCNSYPGFTRDAGLPITALTAIEGITGVTLPVINLATNEVLRQATPGLTAGIGAAIGYDPEEKHFTHVIEFAPDKSDTKVSNDIMGQSYTLEELIKLKKSKISAWQRLWGRTTNGESTVAEANYKQEISILNQLIKKTRSRDEEIENERRLLVCYDYETVYERDGSTKPYCISWCCLDLDAADPLADLPHTMPEFEQKVRADMAGLIVSEHCTNGFLQWLTTSEYVKGFNRVILEAFNGSRFDASFVAELAHSRKMLIAKSLLVVGGGILEGALTGGFKFHDISRFLCGSLAYNCKAFAVERAKVGGFSHADSQSAENAGTLRLWCKTNAARLREYSAFDVLALAELSWKAYKAFQKCPGEPDMFAHPTIASMAYKTLKSELKKRGQKLPTSPQTIEDEELMRGAMYAGRTQMMRGRGSVKGKLYMYDIASSYPFTMLNDQYPTGDYKHTDCEIPGKMGIYRCYIHSQQDGVNEGRPNVNVIPFRDPKGEAPLDWTHSGYIEATITSVDIQEIRAAGNIVDVFEGVYWENSTQENFRPVLAGLEKIKGDQDRYKREKSDEYNPALREASKLFMNSLSGKVAQRMKRKVTILSSDYTTTATALDSLKQNSVNLSVFGKSMLITGTKAEPFNPKKASPCFLACFIYAYARRRLRAALLCGAWYCDTDSALFDEEGARRFREAHPDWLTPPGADKKFGEWEEELGQDGTKDFTCYMVQPKNYAIFGGKEPKIRSKGVGGRDVIISYGQAIDVMAMDEASRGEFCEKHSSATIKNAATAEEVYNAGVESKPIYALCMQFHRECGVGSESNDQSLGGLFSLRQSYTIKQVGGTASDKSEWDTLKKLFSKPIAAAAQTTMQRLANIRLTSKIAIDKYHASPEYLAQRKQAEELRQYRANFM